MVKSLLILALLLQISFLGYAQYYSNPNLNADQKEALRKIEQYTKVKRAGFKLLAGGGAAVIGSIVLISSAEFYTDPYGNRVTDDFNYVWGVLGFTFVGVPLIATGTTLGIIGNYKEKSYMRKLDRLSVSYFNKHGANGIGLVYNF